MPYIYLHFLMLLCLESVTNVILSSLMALKSIFWPVLLIKVLNLIDRFHIRQNIPFENPSLSSSIIVEM